MTVTVGRPIAPSRPSSFDTVPPSNRELARLWQEARTEEQVSIEQRVRSAIAHVTANRVAVSVVDRLTALTGTTVVARSGVLGRCLVDVHALAGHIATGGTVAERAAQLHLGLIDDDFLV